MDLVTISLDLLLAMLLIAALAYGVRLERRLKALRDGHAVFAQAVRELDQSVLRAEAGLDQLRKAGEEARDGLHDRILKAREAKLELERLINRAERVRPQPSAAPEPAPAPLRQLPPAPLARGEAAAERIAAAILNLGESERVPEIRRAEPAPPRAPEPKPSRRAHALALDDDLFEAPSPEIRRSGGLRR
jgi:Domain of unknown function (DUF6468)